MEDLFSAVFHRDTDWEMDRFHFHDLCEILLVTEGTCSVLTESELVRAGRGTVLLIRGRQAHLSTALAGEEYARYVFHFREEDIRPFCGGGTDLLEAFPREGSRTLYLDDSRIREFDFLCGVCQDRTPLFGKDIRRNMAFLELLIRLGEISREERRLPAEREETDPGFERVLPIIRFVRENPEENLSLEEVAERFFYNKYYLCRVFKAATGISVGKYIASVRIQYAAGFLRRGCSVLEAGQKAGFRNNSNFITTFRKIMNISPGQYRQQFKEDGAPEHGNS